MTLVLALVALTCSLAVLWLRRGRSPAPRTARWALVVGLLDLAVVIAAVVGGWAVFMFSWSGPA